MRRAERIRKPAAEAETDEDVIWIAGFMIGDLEYAIPLTVLRAAVPLRTVTAVPRSSRAVIGVLQFHGQVITAISTATLLGSSWDIDPAILLVVDCGNDHIIALDCAQVPLVGTIPVSRYREGAARTNRPFITVPLTGRGPVTVIDVGRLLQEHDWGGSHGGR